MSEYTVQIDASTADGRIWQAVEPAETVDTDDPNTVAYQATDAAEVAQAIAGHQTAVTGDSWRVRVWPGADADTGTEPAAVVNPGQPAVTYTAWVTLDSSALDGDNADVLVLANDAEGQSHGDPLWSAETDTRHDGDPDVALGQARELLAAAGWQVDGTWQAVPTGYIITVTCGEVT